jgi:N-glycosylase/DNA lyase
MQFQIGLTDTPFSLEYTLDSGQAFRWERKGEWWYGVVSGGVLKFRQEGDVLYCETSDEKLDSSFVRRYLGLETDMRHVLSSVMKDSVMTRAFQKFYGMRIMAQERWECLASFVLATNSNIPRIKRMVSSLSERYGPPLEYEGTTHHLFPTPAVLADASVSELEECGLGYRAAFIKRVAASVEEGRIDFSEVAMLDYERAREALLSRLFGEKLLLGVGPKVADCVLLFSCGMYEAFPVDVWVARALLTYYPSLLERRLLEKLSSHKPRLSAGDYCSLSSAARSYFGPYAGYAQQYLFMLSRAEGLK